MCTSLTKNMNRNCFCKNFVYMNKHCRQLQWLYAKLKTLNKGFETTLLLPNFKREREMERKRDGKKEREYLFTCEWIHCWSRIFRGFVFFLATWVFVPLSVRCIYSCTLHSWTQFNALYTHNTSFDIACTKSPGPCQKHISIKAQTSPTVYLFKIMYRIRIQVNILSNLW